MVLRVRFRAVFPGFHINVFNRKRTKSTAIDTTPGVHNLNRGLEKLLRDQRWDKRASDNDPDKNRVLNLVNDPVLYTIQRGNSSEGQTRGH